MSTFETHKLKSIETERLILNKWTLSDEDIEGLYKDARFAKALGFTGKVSISPRHVEGINEVFSPTKAEIEYAHEVLDIIEEAKRMGRGVVSLRGKMIDAPIVARALQTLEAARQLKGGK